MSDEFDNDQDKSAETGDESATDEQVASAEETPEIADGIVEPGPDGEEAEAPAEGRDETTKDGVPMLPGSGDEPTGPEDALGKGPKRGDYSNVTDDTPHFEGDTHQNPHVEEVGDAEGQKGGVDTV